MFSYSFGCFAGNRTSTPYGFPPECTSIHFNSSSSWSAVKCDVPSVPIPPDRDTAATTSRQWENAKIGFSNPKYSITGVSILVDSLLCPMFGGTRLFSETRVVRTPLLRESVDPFFFLVVPELVGHHPTTQKIVLA